MSKKINIDFAEQNEILKRQNELLEQNSLLLQQQNQMLQQNLKVSEVTQTNDEVFVENINTDEMRSGFLVTSHRKKLWNVQIGLINEFARICKKHNLRWFAAYGTLLGAARHRGFVPWDDDVDLIMLRPDYQKFQQIAPKEIKYPYYFDAWYNYRYEGDENPDPSESNLSLFTVEVRKEFSGRFPWFPLIKLRDSRTSMIEYQKCKTHNQGIWIDIFPFDPIPPFNDSDKETMFWVKNELTLATRYPHLIKDALDKNQRFVINSEQMKNFLTMTHRNKALFVEKMNNENFFDSEYVGHACILNKNNLRRHKSKNFEDVVYLPFEKIEVPAPANYDEVLSVSYGDWHKMIITHNHVTEWSVDIPSSEYFKTSAL